MWLNIHTFIPRFLPWDQTFCNFYIQQHSVCVHFWGILFSQFCKVSLKLSSDWDLLLLRSVSCLWSLTQKILFKVKCYICIYTRKLLILLRTQFQNLLIFCMSPIYLFIYFVLLLYFFNLILSLLLFILFYFYLFIHLFIFALKTQHSLELAHNPRVWAKFYHSVIIFSDQIFSVTSAFWTWVYMRKFSCLKNPI